jgi:hypothetical protein
MFPATWSWIHMMVATVAYWALLVGGWYFYTTRPSVQARARERDFGHESFDAETGRLEITYESSIDLGRVALAVLGPPALLVVLWFATRATP